MSYFTISFGQNAISGYPSPAQCGDFRMLVKYNGEPVELSAVSFSIRLDQPPAQVWPERFQPIQPIPNRNPQWDQYLNLRVPLDAKTVSFIEQQRQGGGPLSFNVSVNFHYHRLVPASDSPQSSPSYVLGLGETGQAQAICTVQRDEWLNVLKTIGWQEYEVYEIPATPLRRVERFDRALHLLDQAVAAFRSGEYDSCVVQARRVLEAAAATTGEGDTAPAFAQLWRDVLPDTVDEPKRRTLDQFASGARELRNRAAHGGNLVQIRRSDAQLALTITVALLRYLGQELERTSTPSVAS